MPRGSYNKNKTHCVHGHEYTVSNTVLTKQGRQCRECKRKRNKVRYASHKEAVKRHRSRHRIFVLEYLKTHSCVDCGESDPIVLDFDHVRGDKVAALSELITRSSKSAIINEMAKCEVRCANCHRRKTAKDQGWYRYAV